jgi:hypothetical protein
VNTEHLREIWGPSDFQRMVMAIRAVHAPEFVHTAPVIDILTRQRLA